MISRVRTASLLGTEGRAVTVETYIAQGFPSYSIIGLGDATIKESGERVRAAILNAGMKYPRNRVTVNLSPAGIRKSGSHFDLAIAAGIILAMRKDDGERFRRCAFFGELKLDGSLEPVRGALPLALCAIDNGMDTVIVPEPNAAEAGAAFGAKVIPVRSLSDIEAFLAAPDSFPIYKVRSGSEGEKGGAASFADEIDYAEVKGQESAKRAMEICAAGGHSVIMTGPPGSGKTMLARRLPAILPRMTHDEKVQVTKIYSVAGLLKEGGGMMEKRPFRAPHHTITRAAMLGGGITPAPGEFSLAHMGVLFLDEAPMFDSGVLDGMRQPLEDGRVAISRKHGTTVFPGRVILIAACNPCPCGYMNDPYHTCTCTPGQVASYRKKLSGPVLDRIDMHIDVARVKFEEIDGGSKGLNSEQMKIAVDRARRAGAERSGAAAKTNAEYGPSEIKEYCELSGSCRNFLAAAYEKLGMSMRGHDSMIKVARTIADLDGKKDIDISCLAEAIQYRASSEDRVRGVH